jgi:hypothetical protein
MADNPWTTTTTSSIAESLGVFILDGMSGRTQALEVEGIESVAVQSKFVVSDSAAEAPLGYTISGESTLAAYNTNPSSFGFYFGTTTGVQLNGLGFASQAGWGSGTTYTVKLWSIENGGSTPEDYTELASATFVHGNTYTLRNGYFWQSVSPVVSLPDSSLSDGYVIAAIGNFSGSGGNVQCQTGTAIFDARFVNGVNGFNDATDVSGFYPIPVFDGGVGSTGFFNANFSCVPT